jgi:hypothetical protein
MSTPPGLRPALTAASLLRRQEPQHFLRLLEGHLSALIDSKDTPSWTVNPAYHPDVAAFIREYENNSAFVQRAQRLQQNRAQYYAQARSQGRAPARPTVLGTVRTTVVQAEPAPMGIPVAMPVAVPLDGRPVPVAQVVRPHGP